MSPEVLTAALSGVAVVALLTLLLKSSGADSIVDAGRRLAAYLDGRRGFAWGILFCGLFFLVLQTVYALRMPLADDEFAGARAAFRVTELVPYRDFPPYKTVLGYYIQALPLLLTDNLWAGISLIRVEMAVINTLVVLFVAFRLRRHFRGAAICLALALLVVMSTFVERAYVLRVDMLGSLFGLLTLAFLLERRVAWAGLFAGAGFLVSQKNVYFILAGGAALGSWWLWNLWWQRVNPDSPDERRSSWRELVTRRPQAFIDLALYSSITLAVIVAYFGFWSQIASFEQAVVRVFRQSADIALVDRPFICSREFWWQTLRRNPGFYGTAALALITLVPVVWRQRVWRNSDWRNKSQEEAHPWHSWLLLTFGSAIVALSLWHKQPCPYFFVILIPTLFVVTVSLFDRLLKWQPLSDGRLVRWQALAVLIYLGLGLAVPLSRLPKTLERDNGFQSQNVTLADALLRPEEGYIASLPILYDREQPVAEFRWLDDINRQILHRKSPQELLEVTSRMDRARLKLVIMNYRMEDLPQMLRDYLAYHFAHFWGNVYLYAPFVGRQQSIFEITFEGLYQVDLRGHPGPALINGGPVNHGQLIRLTEGSHTKSFPESVRLRFMPEDLDPALFEAQYREPGSMFGFSFHY